MTVGGRHKVCEWCGQPLSDRQEVACSTSHRLKRWRWLHGITDGEGRVERPPERSVLLLGVDGARPAGSASGRRSNGGLQVSFWKAVRALQGPPLYATETWALQALAPALSDRQRERLGEMTGGVLPGQLELDDEAAA